MIVNLIDVDGTLCPSIFNNDRLKNDNDNCLTPEFLKDLYEVEAFAWFFNRGPDLFNPDHHVNVIVTGRLPEHEAITRAWFDNHVCTGHQENAVHGFVSVPWDDSKATRDESYRDYCARKFMTLLDLITSWLRTLNHSHIKPEFHVYEDDTTVLAAVKKETDWIGPALHLHVVDKQGEVHDYK